jgi:hypothetical protein
MSVLIGLSEEELASIVASGIFLNEAGPEVDIGVAPTTLSACTYDGMMIKTELELRLQQFRVLYSALHVVAVDADMNVFQFPCPHHKLIFANTSQNTTGSASACTPICVRFADELATAFDREFLHDGAGAGIDDMYLDAWIERGTQVFIKNFKGLPGTRVGQIT